MQIKLKHSPPLGGMHTVKGRAHWVCLSPLPLSTSIVNYHSQPERIVNHWLTLEGWEQAHSPYMLNILTSFLVITSVFCVLPISHHRGASELKKA